MKMKVQDITNLDNELEEANNQAFTSSNQPAKNILIIGNTGNGKSTLANVLSGTNKFTESSRGNSQTRSLQVEQFTYQGQTYKIIDTVGLADTSLTRKQVLFKLADIADHLRDGLTQVLLVVKDRVNKQEIHAYKQLKEVILDQNTEELVTVVKTNFDEFENQIACREDKEEMIIESEEKANMINGCREVIHVNNPSVNPNQRRAAIVAAEELRGASREIVLNYLTPLTNQSTTKLANIKQRSEAYLDLVEEIEIQNAKLRQEIAELRASLEKGTKENRDNTTKLQEKIGNLQTKIEENNQQRS